MKSKGFGDTIEKITIAIGIKKLVEIVNNLLGIKDCGCKKRQKKLNNPNLLINKIFYKN